MHFAVFGLGDSGYPLYNAVARRFSQRLQDLGGQILFERGLGDDQHPRGYDGALEPWLAGLWPKLLALSPLPPGVLPMEGKMPDLYEAKVVGQGEIAPFSQFHFAEGTERYRPISCKVLTNQRITHPEHDQDVRHMEFDLTGTGFSYEPGDVLVVHPRNSALTVKACLEWAQLQASDRVLLQPTIHCAQPWTQRVIVSAKSLFEEHLDMQGTPRRSFFEALMSFAVSEKDKDKLTEFASAEFQDDLYKYCRREKRTYLEVLQQFSSCRPPLASLVSLVPRLQPRSFSISSSFSAHPNQAHITMAVVKFLTPWKRVVTGTCSSFLQDLQVGEEVPLWIVKGTISLPKSSAILVGPGTGIAPIKAMCQELNYQKTLKQQQLPSDQLEKLQLHPQEVHVFFGNRYRSKDYLYQQEWAVMVQSGSIASFHAVFSRDQEEKAYVQDLLKQQGALVWSVLAAGGSFILAGNAKKMPTDVRQAVLDICIQHGALDPPQGKKFMTRLEQERRFVMETWA